MKAKSFGLAGILTLFALIAAACGVVTPESLALATEQIEPTTIRIATPRIAGLETQIDLWQREHPTVEVDVHVWSPEDHHEWLADGAVPTAVPGASGAIDIIAFEGTSSAAARSLNDVFMDLSEYNLDHRADQFLEALWLEGINNSGELISLPVDVDAQALLIRNDLASATVTSTLRNARTWCDVIEAGNDFVDSTGTAFFADSEEVLRAVLSQSRSSWVSVQGRPEPDLIDELTYAWSIAMLSIGERTNEDPCEFGSVEGISRNFTPGESIWRAEIASDNFGAVIARWSDRSQIAQAYPESMGSWTAIALPTASGTPSSGSSSANGLHFGIAATSERATIAVDLIATITDPLVQRSSFANGLGPLPSTIAPYANGTVAGATDPFFAGSPTIAAVYAEAVEDRPSGLANPQGQVVIEALVDALARVEGDLETPGQAWDRAMVNIENELRAS